MSDTPGGKLAELVKKNKPVVAIGVVGGALYLMKRGGGSSSDVVNGADGAGTTVQLVPVSAPTDEGSSPQDPGVGYDPGLIPPDPVIPITDPVPVPPTTPPEDSGAPAADTPATGDTPSPAAGQTQGAAAKSGVTIAGRFFPGATKASVVGSGDDKTGHYVIHLLYFTGHTERWYHYTNNTWKGPIASNATNTPSSPTKKPPASKQPQEGDAEVTASGEPRYYWNGNWHTAPKPANDPKPPTVDPGKPNGPGGGGTTSGWTAGNPGWPNPFLQYGAQYRKAGEGNTGNGHYVMYDVQGRTSPGGPWGPTVRVHHYTSGAWNGQWHQA